MNFSAAAVLSALFFASSTYGSSLVINSMHSDPTAKKAFTAVVDSFKKENPDINVTVNTTSHESYKIQIRTWLPNRAPDIATWFAGNRAKYFAEKGLIMPIDDVWKDVGKNFPSGIESSIKFDGKTYLLPASYYHWGFYYRKDLFKEAGITTPPKNWSDFLTAIKKINAVSKTPITIGTKNSWPAAAWFDFINMRLNGYEFHMDLLSGKIPYTDPKVENAMKHWSELVNAKAFTPNHAAMTWQEAMALIWQGKAAMYLMGNFISTEIPEKIRPEIGFFKFPVINPKIAQAEVAPTDVYFIPAKAKNVQNAKKFIRFLAKKESQQMINDLSRLIPPHTAAKVPADDIFLTEGIKLLKEASHHSQFFDRDADPQIAKVAMNGFVEFMLKPSRQKAVLKKIEKTRKRVHR